MPYVACRHIVTRVQCQIRTASLVLAWIITLSGFADAAPKISNMPIRGLQIGATSTVTIQGLELSADSIIVTSLPIESQKVLEATANSLQVELTLAADVTPGIYNLRVMNKNGISDAIVVAADKLPQIAFLPELESLNVAAHGTVSGSTIMKTTFTGKAGQDFLAEVESFRLGGKLRPVLHLYDSHRRQIALALPSPALHGDARLTAQLPADGLYSLELHDLQYAAPAPNFFRLKIGEFQFADAVFPPVVERGKTAKLTFVGNVSATSDVEVTGNGLVQPAPWPAGSNATGLRPLVATSELREVIEERAEQQLQELPSVPVAVSGRIGNAGQEDVYRVTVAEGKKLRFELFADRLGSPMDTVLEVRNDQGGRLAFNDDTTNTTDSMVEYTVAKGIVGVDISIKDQLNRGGEDSVYRLLITEAETVSLSPRFTLKITEDTLNVPQGSRAVFQVAAQRAGYDGAIKIEVENLPAGLTVTAPDIAVGSDGTLVTMTSNAVVDSVVDSSADHIGGVVTKIRGTSVGIEPQVSAVAEFDKHPLGELQPWLRNDIAVALAPANQADFKVDWSDLQDEAQNESLLVLGTTIKTSLRFERPARQIGPIRLSLVVGEPIPIVNNRPDANQSVRAEKATVDIPLDAKAKAALDAVLAAEKVFAAAKAKVDAVPADAVPADAPDEKVNEADVAAMKMAEEKLQAAEAALQEAEKAIKNDAEFSIIIPPNLKASTCDLSLKAELRSADSKTVLATVFTPVRRFVPLNPLQLKLSGEPKFMGKLDAKEGLVLALQGTIERKAGFGGDVTVSISGQPGGVAVPKVVLKPEQNEFNLELKFPANFKPSVVDSIKVFATGPPNPKTANIIVRHEVPITIDVQPADPIVKEE